MEKETAYNTYSKYGAYGLFVDFLYRAYFKYDVSFQIDEISSILFEKTYLTPLTKKSGRTGSLLTKTQAESLLSKNLYSISDKLKKRVYDVDSEIFELIEIFKDKECNNF